MFQSEVLFLNLEDRTGKEWAGTGSGWREAGTQLRMSSWNFHCGAEEGHSASKLGSDFTRFAHACCASSGSRRVIFE